MEQLVLIERDAARRTTTLTLNRPARRNALNLPLLDAIKSALEATAHDHANRHGDCRAREKSGKE